MHKSYFDKFDELFFDIILLNKTMFEDTMTKSLEYKLNLTKDIVNFKTIEIEVEHKGKKKKRTIIIFAEYNTINKLFRWFNYSNEILKEHLNKYDVKDIFGSYKSLDKIFKSEFYIPEKYHLAIPYLMAILNPKFNLVSFATPDNSRYLYAFINLGIKDNFIFEKFISDMSHYKKAVESNSLSSLSRNIIKKIKNKK